MFNIHYCMLIYNFLSFLSQPFFLSKTLLLYLQSLTFLNSQIFKLNIKKSKLNDCNNLNTCYFNNLPFFLQIIFLKLNTIPFNLFIHKGIYKIYMAMLYILKNIQSFIFLLKLFRHYLFKFRDNNQISLHFAS